MAICSKNPGIFFYLVLYSSNTHEIVGIVRRSKQSFFLLVIGSRVLLLGRTLPARFQKRNMFETVQLLLVVNQEVKIPELGLELLHGPYPSWVVSGEGGALEALSQDLVAGADAVRVEGGLEELAASLHELQ